MYIFANYSAPTISLLLLLFEHTAMCSSKVMIQQVMVHSILLLRYFIYSVNSMLSKYIEQANNSFKQYCLWFTNLAVLFTDQ